MPNVPIVPILGTRPGSIAGLSDRFSKPSSPYRNASGFTIQPVTIKDGGRDVAHVSAVSQDGTSWSRIDVAVNPDCTSYAVARVNRLLEGTGVPRFEWYHRTRRVVLRTPGSALDLPLALSVENTPTGWEWKALDASGKLLKQGRGSLVTATSGSVTTARLAPTVMVPTAPPSVVPATSVPYSPPPPPPVEMLVGAANDAPIKVEKGRRPFADPDEVFTFPSRGDTIVVSKDTKEMLDRAWAMHKAGRRQIVALFGPTGSGKTQIVYDWAYSLGVGVSQIDAAGATSTMDWYGSTVLAVKDGHQITEFEPSKLLRAVRADGEFAGFDRIVLIDEVNRAESPAAINALMAMTNSTPQFYVADAKRSFAVDPKVLWVFTGNIGSAYTATIPLDPALKSRITKKAWFDYPSEADEIKIVKAVISGAKRYPETGVSGSTPLDKVAQKLVAAARQTRVLADRGDVDAGVGTRDLVEAAHTVKAGASPLEAAIECWVNGYDRDGGPSSASAKVKAAVEAILRGV